MRRQQKLRLGDANALRASWARFTGGQRKQVPRPRSSREWLSRSLAELDICAVFIDGLHFAEHVVLVALGVDAEGTKHVLGLWEGATENTVACKGLLEDLMTRGLDPKRKRLFVIDGSGGLRAGIRDVFGVAVMRTATESQQLAGHRRCRVVRRHSNGFTTRTAP